MNSQQDDVSAQWFVMRVLKRPNAQVPTYKFLEEIGLEVFTHFAASPEQ